MTSLSMPIADPRYARADKRQVGQLEQTLNRAVFAETDREAPERRRPRRPELRTAKRN